MSAALFATLQSIRLIELDEIRRIVELMGMRPETVDRVEAIRCDDKGAEYSLTAADRTESSLEITPHALALRVGGKRHVFLTRTHPCTLEEGRSFINDAKTLRALKRNAALQAARRVNCGAPFVENPCFTGEAKVPLASNMYRPARETVSFREGISYEISVDETGKLRYKRGGEFVKVGE